MYNGVRPIPSMRASVGEPRTERKTFNPSGRPGWLWLCLILTILSSSTLLQAAGKVGTVPPELRDDVYAIYELVLSTAQQKNASGSESETITINGKNGGREGALRLLKCHIPAPAKKAIYAELFRNFRQALQRRWVIERRFRLTMPYILTNRNDSPRGDGAATHPSRHANSTDVPKNQSTIEATYILSSVGFNKDRSRALVYTSYACGPLCGEDSLNILIKINGRWVFDDEYDGEVCMIKS